MTDWFVGVNGCKQNNHKAELAGIDEMSTTVPFMTERPGVEWSTHHHESQDSFKKRQDNGPKREINGPIGTCFKLFTSQSQKTTN